MALPITGQKTPKPKVSRVAACSVAPVVPEAEVKSASSLVNKEEQSGKQKGALIIMEATSGGALSFLLAKGGQATDNWIPFTMDAAITPATIAQFKFTTDLPATKSVATSAALALTVAASGGVAPYHYAWTKDGAKVGTDAATYNVASAAAGNAGKYKVVVTDTAGTQITSTECTVTVA